jgi:hypothetical protein
MMTYEALVADKSRAGSIRNWVNYAPVPAETILSEAQAFIYKHLRVREMRASTSLSLVSGTEYVALPTDYLSTIGMRSKLYGEMPEYTAEYMDGNIRRYDSSEALLSGKPSCFAVYDERFNFDLNPDAAMTVRLLYYQSPTVLSDTVNTNFLTDKYPTMLRYAALAYAADYMRDMTNYQAWLKQALSEIEGANIEDDANLSHVSTIAEVP